MAEAPRLVRRITHWADRNMPTREGMADNKYLRPIAHRFLRSDLWRFTRRSVPRGVALGLFCGFIIPLGQVFLAAFLALPTRANVPIAAAMTFITNPFTTPFFLYLGNRLGTFLLRIDSLTYGEPLATGLNGTAGEWLSWIVKEAGVTAFGILVLSVIMAAVGYLVAGWGWHWWVAHKWKRRTQRRLAARAEGEIVNSD